MSLSQGVRCVPGHSSSSAAPGDKGCRRIGLDLCARSTCGTRYGPRSCGGYSLTRAEDGSGSTGPGL
ncbi:hypothetical protein SFR_3304 [Streptomyces sp. FR-008]|nr:hypothetical protein SFR_3304 [Streptomyces sp. FR-008]